MRGLLRPLALAVVLAAVGCGERDPDLPPAPPAPPPLALADVGPSAWVLEMPLDDLVVVTPEAVRRGEVSFALEAGEVPAAAVTGGESGFLVEGLRPLLTRAAEGPLALAVAPSVSYRTVARVLYTAGQGGVAAFAFVVRSGARQAVLPIDLPNLGNGPRVLGALSPTPNDDDDALLDVLRGGPAADPDPSRAPAHERRHEPEPERSETFLNLYVNLEAAGLVVGGSGGRLAPGCQEIASARTPTIVARDGAPDLDALATCLRGIKALYEDETQVLVGATMDTRFEALARVIAAARGTRDAPLFPDAVLVVGMR